MRGNQLGYEVERYRKRSGMEPFTEWLLGLRDRKLQAGVVRRLTRIAEGNLGDHKFIREGVWELRIDVGPGYRVYYALIGQRVVLLLCGGDKDTQNRDIDMAYRYWREWKLRGDE